MTFKAAKKKLAKIANGKYHSVEFTLTEYHGGELKSECCVYIGGGTHHKGSTWELAFGSLASATRTEEEIYKIAP